MRVIGHDGKSYPYRPLSAEDRAFLVGRVHYLAHDERLSVRQILARLAEENGVRRSVGTVSSWLSQPCVACVQVRQNGAPEHSRMPSRAALYGSQ